MDDFSDIARFLRGRGHTSLFAYYGLDEKTEAPEVLRAIDERRRWAQTQQANRQNASEALWLIQNQGLVRRTLLEHREAYLATLQNEAAERHAEHLKTFIRGAMHGGQFAREAEREVRKLAGRLRVPEDFVEALIVDLIGETGAIRRSRTIDPETSALLTRVQEVLASGALPSGELDHILKRGTLKSLEPKVIIRKIDDAVRQAAVTVNAQTAMRSQREEARTAGVWNLVEAVRGMFIARAFSKSAARSLEREALGQGMDLKTAESLTGEALCLWQSHEKGSFDAHHALGMPASTPLSRMREAYTALRAMTTARADLTAAAKATMRLDLAWALVNR